MPETAPLRTGTHAESKQALRTRLRPAHHPSGYASGFDPTSRCHKRELLLRFAGDRRRWLQWFFEAKKRYGLCVLNFMATSNHVHLLIRDNGNRDVIPKSIQLIAGKTGQEMNLPATEQRGIYKKHGNAPSGGE